MLVINKAHFLTHNAQVQECLACWTWVVFDFGMSSLALLLSQKLWNPFLSEIQNF